MSKLIRIGSRGSDLALWQAHFFQDALKDIGVESEIKVIKTKGDRIQHLSFDKIEGKGFFTKEIEEQLLAKEVDVAIHSHKDLETTSPPGLTIAGVSYRENPAELLLVRKECVDLSRPLQLKSNPTVGTSSARRQSQVLGLRPDVKIKDIRGNVPTRIDKLRSGDFDAILLAAAGVQRLKLDVSDLHVVELDPALFIPAPAQGVLAYQCRSEDSETIEVIQKLHHADVEERIDIERTILKSFGGGCHIPIGAYVNKNGSGYRVRVSYGDNIENMPKRMAFDAKDKTEALSLFQEKISSTRTESIYITKDLGADHYINRYCAANNIQLSASPQISIKPLPFELTDDFDWIFFASSNAAHAFFGGAELNAIKGKKIGVFGHGTAQAVSEYVDDIAFIGDQSDSAVVAASFAEMIGEQRVLFPISDISMRSIQSRLPADQVVDLVVYSTVETPHLVEAHDAYVFTSPSNVRSFFLANSIPEEAQVIAIGPSTAKALSDAGFKALTADIPDGAELLALIAS